MDKAPSINCTHRCPGMYWGEKTISSGFTLNTGKLFFTDSFR